MALLFTQGSSKLIQVFFMVACQDILRLGSLGHLILILPCTNYKLQSIQHPSVSAIGSKEFRGLPVSSQSQTAILFSLFQPTSVILKDAILGIVEWGLFCTVARTHPSFPIHLNGGNKLSMMALYMPRFVNMLSLEFKVSLRVSANCRLSR